MTERLFVLARRVAADESGQTIAEYALVMAVLTMGMVVAFDYVSASGNGAVNQNEGNMSKMASRAQ